MEFFATPPLVHSAFNPIIVHVRTGDYDTPYAELTIKCESNSVVMKRRLTEIVGMYDDYETIFDISSVVQSLFDYGTNMSLDDKRLYVCYTIEVKDVGDPPIKLMAINASAGPVKGIDWAPRQTLGLYYSLNKVIYKGFPLECSFLNPYDSDDGYMQKALYHIAITEDAVKEEFDFGNDFVSYHIKQECVPENPFYVRWLNRLGGIDYYMFHSSQEFENTVKDVNNINIHNTAYQRTFSVKSESTVVVGAEMLSIIEYNRLIEISTSPIVEWYNQEIKEWMPITIFKANNKRKSDLSMNSLEFEFKMPTANLQFI